MRQHAIIRPSAVATLGITFVASTLLAGCASSGAPAGGAMSGMRSIETGETMGARLGSLPEFKSAHRSSVQLPVATAWTRLGMAYQSMGIALTVSDAPSLTLGNEGMRRTHTLGGARMSDFLDCGTGTGGGPNADLYAVTLSVVSQLQAASESTTRVATLVEATAAPLTFGSPPVACSTTGNLEERIAALVREAVAR